MAMLPPMRPRPIIASSIALSSTSSAPLGRDIVRVVEGVHTQDRPGDGGAEFEAEELLAQIEPVAKRNCGHGLSGAAQLVDGRVELVAELQVDEQPFAVAQRTAGGLGFAPAARGEPGCPGGKG